MMEQYFENETFLKICFRDEATFHISRKLNRHNVKIWGLERPHAAWKPYRNSLKVHV